MALVDCEFMFCLCHLVMAGRVVPPKSTWNKQNVNVDKALDIRVKSFRAIYQILRLARKTLFFLTMLSVSLTFNLI